MLRKAEITQDFLDFVVQQTTQVEYAAPKHKGDAPALTVLSIGEEGSDPKDRYYFSRRAGKDSVAFVLYDSSRTERPYQLLSQWHGPLKRFILGAFTGSLDKPDLSPLDHLVEEVLEEAGYVVTPDRVQLLGYEPVSSQTDESVYLYVVDITGITPQRKEPENLFEKNTQRYWCSATTVRKRAEWKAKVIVQLHAHAQQG